MENPWLNNDRWRRTVRSDAKKSMIAAWCFAGFWNLVAWPGVMVLPEELARENWAALLVLLFPTVGLLLVFWAVRLTREWFRYGVTELRLDPYPGAIGGHVGGTIKVQGVDPGCEFQVLLECVRSFVKTSSGERKREATVIWQTKGLAEAAGASGFVDVRFRFDVPDGLPASEDPDQDDYHAWHVKLICHQADVVLDRQFEIAVFQTAEKSRHLGVDTTARAKTGAERVLSSALIDPQHRARLLEEHRLEVDEQNGWLRLYLHRGRQRGMALLALLVGAVFTSFMVFVPEQGFSSLVIRIAFGCFGICLLSLSAYLPFNTLDVRINRQQLKRVRSWLGMAVRSQEIAPSDLRALEIDKGASTTAGTRTTIYYELTGKGDFGCFKFVESIPDRMLVEAIRRQVMLAAGLRLSTDS